MLFGTEDLHSFTQNLNAHEKKMTMAEAVVLLTDFFQNCVEKKRASRTGSEYTLNISIYYIKNTLKKGKATKNGTWLNLIQNARDLANLIWFYLDEREKVELEYIFSYISGLNGKKAVSEYRKDARSGQCKYCWRHTSIDGKGKIFACSQHSNGSRDLENRKIMRLKDNIHAIRARVHPYIYVGYETLSVSVSSDVCPHLSKLMEHQQRTLQEMFKLLDFDIGVNGVEIFELVWSMATYEAWHQAHAGALTDMPEADQDVITEITDEMWEQFNRPVEPAPLAPNLLHST